MPCYNSPQRIHMRLPIKISAILLSSVFTACVSANNKQPEKPQPVVLESTQIFTFYSPTTQQNYRIQVQLPGDYQTNLAKKYPIIIKLDGQWDFPLAASVFNNIYFDGQMPQTIVAGIDWADVEDNVHRVRARDLLPEPISAFEKSGQAKKFVDAIANDIIPELDHRFRLNGQEYLLGGSWGATFATFALLDRPQIFDGAIAIAGDYQIANKVFDQQIKTISKSKLLSGKRLYIGVGKQDRIAPVVAGYVKKLQQAKPKEFSFQFDHLDGFGHSGMNVPGYAKGYKYMFARPQLALPQKTLDKYVGNYQSTNTDSAEMSVGTTPQGLIVSIDGAQLELFAQSENSFYYEGSFFNLHFDGPTARLETFGGERIFQRIESKQR